MKKNLLYIIVALLTFSGCKKKVEYDIEWPQPEILSVSSLNAPMSSTLTLSGNFEKVVKVSFAEVEGDNLVVAPDGMSLTVDVPRTMDVLGGPITTYNDYKQTYTYDQDFIPIIPETTVSKVSPIQAGLTFIVSGDNVDLLTEVKVNGEEASITSKTPDAVLVSSAGLNIKPGGLADVSFKSLAKNDVPTVKQVDVVHPFIVYKDVVIWDFEDDQHAYVGEGTVTIEEEQWNGEAMKYFSLRGPGYGWDKATGEMTYEEVPDLASIVNPYLTFMVRTPAGSAGYFQLEDQNGNWRHFGYGFDTNGEWMIISQPLEEGWEGGDFVKGAFKPKLGFKAGNAGDNQDIDIAFLKITEGPYDGSQNPGDILGGSAKPNLIKLMDFEDASQWPDIMNGTEVIGSTTFRPEIGAFAGDGFFTYLDDGSQGGWGAYWGGSLSTTEIANHDLTVYDDPYLSFALNTSPENQYVMVRMWQFGEKLEMVMKYFPNTDENWHTFQFSLFESFPENWSKGGTELTDYYTTMKQLDRFQPIDKIEFIIGKHGDNEIIISIDEVVITEGPRF